MKRSILLSSEKKIINANVKYCRNDVQHNVKIGINVIDKKYDSKTKTYIENTVCHRFTGFDNYQLLFEYMQNLDNQDRCCFEIIHDNCKPYLDVEYVPQEQPQIDPSIIKNIVNDIIKIFEIDYKLKLSEQDIIACNAHKYNDNNQIIKYSWHIIISPLTYNCVYQNNNFNNENCAADLIFRLCQINEKYIEVIDRSVYSKFREMRMFLCNKVPTESRILKWNDYDIKKMDFKTYSRSFINYIDSNLEIVSIETPYRPNPDTFFKTKKETVQIEEKKKQFEKNKSAKLKQIQDRDSKINKENNNNNNKSTDNNNKISNKYKYVEEIVDNIADYRSDKYDQWIRIKWALKNQSVIDNDDYFNIFDSFSKKSNKYDKDEVIEEWNNQMYKSGGVTLGTLIMMLKEDNIEALKYIHNKYELANPRKIIEEFYNPDITKYFKHIIKYEDAMTQDFVVNEGQKGCVVGMEMSMGKTNTLFKQVRGHNNSFLTKKIKNMPDKTFLNYDKIYHRILVISHRRSIAAKFFGDLEALNFELYFDYKNKTIIEANRLIIQLDSLHKVDLVTPTLNMME
ncbi:hypothetical protein Catovirus_1_54 [Catovirus CTV1]|uniref:Primase C-terminal 2 domain-containing protein n=1 Tax=Catovirus CTV1 TaxID=1977631 RepID=A0A1V0S8H3_9VIRU|nr:hypothetical protein Catovirus_1_54 [Catovirus CTV1]